MKSRTALSVSMFLILSTPQSYSQSRNFYVDASGGSDANSGLSPSAAWKTVEKVNTSSYAPGDSILFKRGESFRGSLVPASGSSAGYITYSAYGAGYKPKLLGAYDRSSPSDWTDQGGNVWRTSNRSVGVVGSELLPNPDFSTDLSSWATYDDPGGGTTSTFSRTTKPGEYFTSPGGGKIAFAIPGKVQSTVQLFTSRWSVGSSTWYRFSFKAKAVRPLTIPADNIVLHKEGPPWTRYSSLVTPPVAITTQWTSYDIYFYATSTANDSRITFYFSNFMADGDTLYIDALSFKECDAIPELLSVDVGNIIFNNESSCGVKVWNRSDLNTQGRFWYDEENDLLEMYSSGNPGSQYSKIELALNWDIISVTNKSYFICDNLDLRYGANGFQATETHHTLVRNCDFSFIGGADQYGGSQTVRFGNGATFWNGNHDNVVERCTFNQIYDAATSAQGVDNAGYEVYNIYFRNNVINNSEYSFEYWEGGSLSKAHDIYFENNTCLNAGRGWSHSQRPDPNGTHLMFFPQDAQTTRVYIRNNVFYNAADQGIRWWWKEDIDKMVLDHNCWYQSSGLLARIELQQGVGLVNITYDYATQWENYKVATRQDSNSIHGDPLLNSDRTLQASSPCIDAGVTLSTVTNDFNGVARPQGVTYDIGAFEAPAWLVAAPTLLAPADNMKKAPIDPTLSWKKLPRAQKYSLVVSLTPTFSSLVVTDTSLVDTTKAIGPLQYGTTYYWRVCAKNVGGTSDWSQVRSFTTIHATPAGPTFYVSPTGNDSNPGTESLPWKTLAKAGSMAMAGVTIFIKQGTYRERLVPSNSGTADAPITFTAYPGDSVTITGMGLNLQPGWPTGLVHVQGQKYITVSGLRVVNSVASGILVNESQHITIERNYTDSTNSPGIVISQSDNVVVEGNEVVHGCMSGDQECISFMTVDLFEIRNNRVHDGFTEGIDVKVGSSNGIVAGNEVYNQGVPLRQGIYIDAWNSHEFNIDVFDNASHDNAHGIAVASEDGGLLDNIRIHNNRVFRNGWGFAVVGWGVAQTPHPMRNIEIYGNVDFANQIGIEIAGYSGTTIDSLNVHNNLICNNSNTGISIGRFDGPTGLYVMRNIAITNNTIHGNGTSSNGWGDGGINVTNFTPDNLVIRNNILSRNSAYTICVQAEVPRAGVIIDYNFLDGFVNFPYETAGTNAVYGSPLFVDTLRNDYHLQTGSPCIDKGNPAQKYNDPADPNKPGYALFPALGTVRNDMGAYGGPYAGFSDRTVIPVPSAPNLTGPADAARSVSVTPTLSWDRTLGAVTYRLQVSLNTWFSTTIIDDSTIAETFKSVGALQNGTTYFWRVNAKNEGGTSAWSQVMSFTTTVEAPLGTAYYVSPTGNDSNPGTEALPWKTFAKATSMATAGVTIFIKQGIYRERLVPVNSGRADAPITFTCYPGDSVTITGVGLTPPTGWWAGLIWMQGMQYIKISGLRVIGSPNTGIDMGNCSYITIEHNFVDSTYSPGIKAHSSENVIVQGNEVVQACMGLEEEALSVSTVNFVEIRNNLVRDGFTEGIDVKAGSSNVIVTKNEVYGSKTRSAIYVDAWDARTFNVEVFDNISHDNGVGMSIAAENGGVLEKVRIYHNKVFRNTRGFWVAGMGIGQTHTMRNIEIYGNEFYENGFGIEIGGYTGTTMDSVRVFNNLIYHNKGTAMRISRYDGPSGAYAMRNVAIVNNTIHGNGTVGNGWDADNAGINIFNISPENLLIRNNVVTSNAICTIFVGPEVPAGSVIIDYNFFSAFRNYPYETTGTNPVSGNPLFVDSLANDYHLQDASPCIDKGNPNQVYNDPTDPARPGYALYPALGTVRNDIGAYGGSYAGFWDLATSVARPQIPALSSPADSARNVSLTPMLSWTGILGTDRYRIQLSSAANFASKLVDDSMVTDCYRQVGPLQNNTTYFWRVNATNVAGTCSWSQMRTFTTIVAAPSVPTLAGPADSTKNVQLTTILSWNSVQGATLYHLQVSTTSNFASTLVDDSTLTAVSRSVSPLALATTYRWRVQAKNDGGWSPFSPARQFTTIRTTSVQQLNSEIPKEYSLSQNYPNPFNPSTRIRFGIPKSSKVSVKVFDLLGREIETLVAEELTPAYYETVWKANVASGIYFFRIQASDFVKTKKMMLLH